MAIELKTEVSTPTRYVRDPFPVKRVSFKSRNADFQIATNEHDWTDRAVHFYVGPIGLHVNPDEAEALGKALIECAQYFRTQIATEA